VGLTKAKPLRGVIRSLPDLGRIILNPRKLLRVQGYRELDRVSPAIADAAKSAANIAAALARPAGAFRIVSTEVTAIDSVCIEGGVIFRSAALAHYLRHGRDAAVFVATIGPELERRVDELYEAGSYLEWLFLESAGNLAVHVAVSQLRTRIAEATLALGYRLIGRLGPGHGDWPLADQPRLFALLDGASLPVVLSEHAVMTPRKSISGLCGICPVGRSPHL
jgi:hypothetical protein